MTSATLTDWIVFAAIVLASALFDRIVLGRSHDYVPFREAMLRSVLWVSVGIAFTLYVWLSLGRKQGIDYLLAFVVEKSLSVDNLFVFLVVFTYFGVKEPLQRRVLVWGVAGAVVMRAVFIVAGAALLSRFHWMMYVFGAFLVFTGVRLALRRDEEVDPESNLALKLARRFLRTTPSYDGDRFFTVKDGVRFATPLLLVLVVIEFTDLVFAVDSVPAVLAISKDLFVVYTSNVFAILGLRALYFLLAGMMSRFHYLSYGLAAILVFIGGKMLLESVFEIPGWASLIVICTLLGSAIAASFLRKETPPESLPGASGQ